MTDNNAWVFDSLVGFLHGPVWNMPLQTFIEEKSLPFEPTDNGEVLERAEYKHIHEQYKNLVDVMLGSFMEDIGISADQFEAACKLSANDLAGLPAHFHRRLFEQIWAANDYEIFVKMMTHKNVELQLQALELIERRIGMLPNIFSSGLDNLDSTRSEDSEDGSDKDDVMMEIKKLRLEELRIEDEVKVPPQDVVAEKKNLISKLQSFENKEPSDGRDDCAPKTSEVEHKVPELAKAPVATKVQVSEEELNARQVYLKQQRDKLLALKKQVREKRLDAVDEETRHGEGEGSSRRPKSARLAHAALAGAPLPPPPDVLQLRRALASKLKTEVVDTKH